MKTKSEVQKELAYRTLARRHLLHFTTYTFPKYKPGWVHDDICRRLERFAIQIEEGRSPRLMLLVPPRNGKALSDDTLVPTPEGLRPHGRLKAGDYVFSYTGEPTQVRAVGAEVAITHEITFTDNEVIRAHALHEWYVWDRSRRRHVVVETRSLVPGRHFLPPPPALRYPVSSEPLLVDPYFLGVWLGDGASAEPRICGAEADLEHIAGQIHYDKGSRYIHPGTGVHYQYYKGIVASLRTLSVLGNKHIPEQYLRATQPERRALLAGLVDTDGSVESPSGRVRFSSVSERLVRDVQTLVRSFGYRASVHYVPEDTRDRPIHGGALWCVQWTPHDGQGGGTLPRKVCGRVRTRARTGIRHVVRMQTPVPGRCVQVAARDGLYLASASHKVTHNSELASIRFPAWYLGHNPDHDIINVGYNLDLPLSFSRKVRSLLRDTRYHTLFPQTRLRSDTQSAEQWATTAGGGYIASGVGGGITGKGAHVLTIDDPIKNQKDAESLNVRNDLWDFYQSTAMTRLAPGGGVLLIETWWHDNDLAGRLQEAARKNPFADQFEIVRYPALSEQWEYRHKETLDIVRTDEYEPSLLLQGYELLRPKDQALHPERYDTAYMKRLRENLQPRIWSALYQQNPVPDEGIYFRKEYIVTESEAPQPKGLRTFTTWDFAIGTKQQNDFTVGTTVTQDFEDVLHLRDVCRIKVDTLQIVENMLRVAEQYRDVPGYFIGVEKGQIWLSIEPLLRKTMQERKLYVPYEVLTPQHDKMVRARPLQGRMQQGKVRILANAPWFSAVEQELLRFPAGAHDDIVDALAWAAQLSISRPPPRPKKRPRRKSWKDKLDALVRSKSGDHMTA